jgi:hypothetical protein
MRRTWVWTAVGAGLFVVAGAIALVLVLVLRGGPTPIAPAGTRGYDVSWPQCSGSSAGRMPPGKPPYLILGLTAGSGHTANPCLADQVGWARDHGTRVGAYLVASYPSVAQLAAAGSGPFGTCAGRAEMLCRLRNDGASQARDGLATMRAAGIASPLVWIDVEHLHLRPWTQSRLRNAAVLQGVVRGLRAARVQPGVYSTSVMWQEIAGRYRLDVPNWLPTGGGSRREAAAYCTETATGGPTWLVQYTRSFDIDLTCPPLDRAVQVAGQPTRYRLVLSRIAVAP